MQAKCNLDLSFCLADGEFSLDELVYKRRDIKEWYTFVHDVKDTKNESIILKICFIRRQKKN